jgi:hypothetical protein
VRLQGDIEYQYKRFLHDTGRDPSDKERAQFALDYLAERGRIPDGKHTEFAKSLKGLVDEGDIRSFKNAVMAQYANGKALRRWDSDVRAVASFKHDSFDRKVGILYEQGLVPQKRYRVSQETLYDYGRRFVAYQQKARDLHDRIGRGEATTDDMRAFEGANDKPVNGLPSFVRISWAHLSTSEQQDALHTNTTAKWSSLTSFEKTLLGQKADPRVTAGWAKLNEIVAGQRAELARQGRSFPSGYKRTLAKYVEKYYDAPGLVKDFDFAAQPLVERMKRLKPIQQSPHAAEWSQVFRVASTYAKYLRSPDYTETQVRQMWRDYVTKSLDPWVAGNPSFRREVDAYGRGLLERLVS